MQVPKVITIAFLLILFSQCKSKPASENPDNFYVSVSYFAGAIGQSKYFSIKNDTLKVSTNCDFQNCIQRTLYQRLLTKEESDRFYKFISLLSIFRLEDYYGDPHIMDGIEKTLYFKNKEHKEKSIRFSNYSSPKLDAIQFEIDKLILSKEYRSTHLWW